MNYFLSKGLVKNDPYEIARFIHGTSSLVKSKIRQYVQGRQDIVEHLVSLQNFANTFLPNALRRFFSKLEAPNDRGSYLQVGKRQCEYTINSKFPRGYLSNFLWGFASATPPWVWVWTPYMWCASPWSSCLWTSAPPMSRTKCPRESSSGIPGGLLRQKVKLFFN